MSHIDTLDLQKYFKEPINYTCRTLFNHLGRYFYAVQKLNITKNDIILDCSCGQGYGSYNLALNAKEVWATDINIEYIQKAKEIFKLNNLYFITPLENNDIGMPLGIDKIICIETIEHIEKDKQEYFLSRLCAAINHEKGQLFLSFPVGENKPSDYNTFHLCEPSIEVIYSIMKKYFNRIEIETSKFVNNYNKECEYCYMIGKK